VAYFIRIIEVIIVALMGAIAAVVIAEVGLRAAFGFSLIITDEFSRYLMVWTAMLAAAVLVYEDGHIRTTMLPDALPPFYAGVLLAVSDVIVLIYLSVAIAASLMLLPSIAGQDTVTLGISMVWFHAAIPVSMILMFVLTARAFVLRLLDLRSAPRA
jgi:TRAP-type C4-dicarboxylate transport system permease small subunit